MNNDDLDLWLLTEKLKYEESLQKAHQKSEEMKIEMYGESNLKRKKLNKAKRIDGIEIAYRAIKKCELELKRLFNK